MTANDDEPKWVAQLRSLDPRSYAKQHGTEALRRLLVDFSSDELKAFARDKGIVSGGVSKLSKSDIVNRIVVSTRAA